VRTDMLVILCDGLTDREVLSRPSELAKMVLARDMIFHLVGDSIVPDA
jgi:hypothetical protein